MDHTAWQILVDQMRSVSRVEFDIGLTDAEVDAVEKQYGFRFPSDLREFLQTALPCGPKFPNWRSGDELKLREMLDFPRQGILFDVQHCGFWHEDWERRPDSSEEALRLADKQLNTVPRLIPVYGHRMMPAEPHLAGNPVYSIWQTDIIYYGFDLADYLRNEFHLPNRKPWPAQLRQIRFWNYFVA